MVQPIKDLPEKTIPLKDDYILFSVDLGGGVYETKKMTVGDLLNSTMNIIPAVRVSRTANFSNNAGTTNTISYNVANFNVDSMWSATVNPERLTVNTAGKYLVFFQASFTGNSGQTVLIIRRSTGNVVISRVDTEYYNYGTRIQCAALVDVPAGEYFTSQIYTANTLTVYGNTVESPVFGAVRLG